MNVHWTERLRREIKHNFGTNEFTAAQLYPYLKSYRCCPMTYAGLTKQLKIIGCQKAGTARACSSDETYHEILKWRLP